MNEMFDRYEVSEAEVRAIMNVGNVDAEDQADVAVTGVLLRLLATVRSMEDRGDANSRFSVGASEREMVKGSGGFPASGEYFFGHEGVVTSAPLVWESLGGEWSPRKWRLRGTLVTEVDLIYGDTHVTLVDINLAAVGRTGATVFTGDALSELLVGPLQEHLTRVNTRAMMGVELESDRESPSDCDDEEWIARRAMTTWDGWGSPEEFRNLTPWVITVDGQELEESGTPACVPAGDWRFWADRDAMAQAVQDLPAPTRGVGLIVTKDVAVLAPWRKDLWTLPNLGGAIISTATGEERKAEVEF